MRLPTTAVDALTYDDFILYCVFGYQKSPSLACMYVRDDNIHKLSSVNGTPTFIRGGVSVETFVKGYEICLFFEQQEEALNVIRKLTVGTPGALKAIRALLN